MRSMSSSSPTQRSATCADASTTTRPAGAAPPATRCTGYRGCCSQLPSRSPTAATPSRAACSPPGTPFDAWHAKQTVRLIYRIPEHNLAVEALDELARDLRDEAFSPELNRLGRTLLDTLTPR